MRVLGEGVLKQVVKKGRGEGSVRRVEVAEWSKAVDSGSIPKGRGFKSHLQHFLISSPFTFDQIFALKNSMRLERLANICFQTRRLREMYRNK